MGAQATKADIEGVEAALKKLGEDVQAALEKQGGDFKERVATKTDVVAATNRNPLGTPAGAALLFAAIQLFPEPRSGYSASSASEAEFMQKRRPVGAGPSGKTCPKCASQLAHSTSMRRMNIESSSRVTTASGVIG